MIDETTSLKEFLKGRSEEDQRLLLSAAIHLNKLSQDAYSLERQQVARVQATRWWSLAPIAFVLWSLQFTDVSNAFYTLGAAVVCISAIVAICSIFSKLRAMFVAPRIRRAIGRTNMMSFRKFGAYYPAALESVAKFGPQAATLYALDGQVHLKPDLSRLSEYPQYFRSGGPYPPWSMVAVKSVRQ